MYILYMFHNSVRRDSSALQHTQALLFHCMCAVSSPEIVPTRCLNTTLYRYIYYYYCSASNILVNYTFSDNKDGCDGGAAIR
jgi:hypothetical protein